MSKNKNIAILQRQFSAHIFNRGDEKITDFLPYSNQESLARLNIYRNNVFGNFFSVLSMIFPAVKKNIGDKKFKKFVEDYQINHPSKNGNLDQYGDEFPIFLKKQKLAFLSDLAQLELFYHNCYFAKNVKDFDIENFKKLAPEKLFNLKFNLHPSCFLMESKFAIFSALKNDSKKSSPLKNPEFILIERVLDKCQIHKLTWMEFEFLNNLFKGKNLYQIYQKITKTTKTEFDIGKMLNKFITSRIIAEYL